MFQISLPDVLMKTMITEPAKHAVNAVNADIYNLQSERDAEQVGSFKIRNIENSIA